MSDLPGFVRTLDVVPDFYIVISKDPYSWLISYRNWAQTCNWPKVEHHYILEYNLFHAKWLELARHTDRIVFVRYVDLLRNARAELGRLELSMGLHRRLVGRFLGNSVGKVTLSERFNRQRSAYYTEEQYLERYTDAELNEVNGLLDPVVLAGLGYQKRSPRKNSAAPVVR